MDRLRVFGWRSVPVLGIVLLLLLITVAPWVIEPVLLIAIGASAVLVAATRRRSRHATAAAAVIVLATAWALVLAPGAMLSSVDLRTEAFDRIHYGMTQDEVEALLGGPPGNYGRYSARDTMQTAEGFVGPWRSRVLFWSNDETQLEIAFLNGRVADKHVRAGYGRQRGVVSRIRRILEFRALGPPFELDFSRFPNDDPRDPPRPLPAVDSVEPKTIPIPRGRPAPVASVPVGCTWKLVTYGDYPFRDTHELTVGSDGALWLDGLGRRSMSGHRWGMGIGGAQINGLVTGPDGALWFTDAGRIAIRRVSVNGVMTEFPLPTRRATTGPQPNAWPAGLTVRRDGALWFVESSADKIARISSDGRITEYDIPRGKAYHANPEEIVATDDGALWFTQPLTDTLGRFDPRTKRFSEVRVPTDSRFDLGPTSIAADGDDVWFTLDTDLVGRVSAKKVETFRIPDAGTRAGAIHVDARRDVWVLDHGLHRVLRLNRDGEREAAYTFNAIERRHVRDIDQPRDDIVTGPDGAIWFTLQDYGRLGRIGCPTR